MTANEVKIVITGTNASGPAFVAARADMESLGKSTDVVTDKLNKQQHESTSLEHEMAALAAEAKLLGLSFETIGTKTETTTKSTTRLRDELGRFKKDTEAITKDVGKDLTDVFKFTGGGQGFGNFIKGFADTGKLIGKTLSKEASNAFDGNGIMEKISSALSNPVTGPAIGGALLAILPGLGSTIGAAIQLAAGGTWLAAGLMIAAKDQQVHVALSGLKSDIMDGLRGATAPFRAELIATTGVLSDGFHNVLPGIKETFAALAPAIQPLAKGLVGLVQEMLPGMEEAAKALGPLFKELGQDLPLLGRAIGDMFHDTAQGGNSAAVSMHFLIETVAVLIGMLGVAIKTAEILFDIQLHPQNILKDIKSFNDLQATTQAVGHSLTDAGDAAGGFQLNAKDAAKEAKALGNEVWTASDALDQLNAAFDNAIQRMIQMNDSQAAITLGMDNLKKSFKKGKDALDENTVAGATNVQMIDGLISKLEERRQKEIAAGNGTQEATNKANAAYNEQLKKLGEMLVSLGVNKKAVQDFLGAFVNKDVTVSVHIKVTQTGPVSAQGVISSGVPLHGAYAHAGVVGGAASGGLRSGLSWVGENGPELMDLSGMAGAQIYTAGDSKRIAAGGGGFGRNAMGATPQTFKFLIDNMGKSEFARIMAQLLRDYVLIQGGDGSVLGINH